MSYATPTLIRQAAANNLVGAAVATLGATPAVGNVLLAGVGVNSTGATVTLTQTNVVWTLLVDRHVTRFTQLWGGVVSGSAGTAVSLSDGGANIGKVLNVSEWSGLDPTAILDVAGVVGNGTSDGLTGLAPLGSISPTLPGLILTMLSQTNPSGTAPTNGFTLLTGQSSSGITLTMSYLVVPNPPASPYTTAVSLSPGTAYEYAMGAFVPLFADPAVPLMPMRKSQFVPRQNALRPYAFAPGLPR